VVRLGGSGFTGDSGVSFGSTAATTFTVLSDNALTVVSPPGNGSANVTVTTYSGTSSPLGISFGYTVPTSAFTGISPATGGSGGGTRVVITGSGFSHVYAVSFGDTPSPDFTVLSDTTIVATA